MKRYRMLLDFTAADDAQAARLAVAWAATCAAEYSTEHGGTFRLSDGLPVSDDACVWHPTGDPRIIGEHGTRSEAQKADDARLERARRAIIARGGVPITNADLDASASVDQAVLAGEPDAVHQLEGGDDDLMKEST